MGVEGAAEQARTDGVPEHTSFLCLEFEIGFVRTELHALPASGELKGPGARCNLCLELELAREPRSDGTDAFHRLVASTLGVNNGGIQTADGNGRFIHHINDDHDDVLIVVINLHSNRSQMGVQRACSGAVLITHVGSPVVTDGWLYFNGLPQSDAISAIVDGSRKAGTSPRRRPCGALHPPLFGTLLRLSRRCRCPVVQTTAGRERG